MPHFKNHSYNITALFLETSLKADNEAGIVPFVEGKKNQTIATSNTDRTQGLSCLLAVWKGFETLKEWGIIGRAVMKKFHSHTDVFRVLTQHWKKDLLFPVWTAPELFQELLSKYFSVRKYHPVKCLIYRPLKIFPPLIKRWVLMTSFWNFSNARTALFHFKFCFGILMGIREAILHVSVVLSFLLWYHWHHYMSFGCTT